MPTPLRDRLSHLARNCAPVTTADLSALWHAGAATVMGTLRLAGYVRVDGNWHHPDHALVSDQSAVSSSQTVTFAEASTPAAPKTAPLALISPVVRRRSAVNPPPSWYSCDPIDLVADLEATKVTRTWLLANVQPEQWPHPHRTPCPTCSLLQPCLNLSRHRQATICEAVITQRRIDYANLSDQPDFHRTPARFGAAGQEDLRTLHPAQSAAVAAR